MARFVAAYRHPAGTPLERLAPLTVERRRPAGSASISVGLGWHIVDQNGGKVLNHSGQTGGFAAFVGINMASGANVVVLSNSVGNAEDIGWHLLDPSIPLRVSLPVAARKEIAVAPSVLDRFVGQYRLPPADLITISRKGGSLWARIANLDNELFAEAQDAFFMKAYDAQITFLTDASGYVTSLTMRYGGREVAASRLK
jgi:CubicO group peptidase (beta-lactamase class C family)